MFDGARPKVAVVGPVGSVKQRGLTHVVRYQIAHLPHVNTVVAVTAIFILYLET